MQQFASRGARNKAARLTIIILWTKPAGSSEVVLNYHNDCTSTVVLPIYVFCLCETHNHILYEPHHHTFWRHFVLCLYVDLFVVQSQNKQKSSELHIDSQYCKMRSTLNDYKVTIMFSRSQLLRSFTILTAATLVDGVTKERRDAFIPGVRPDVYDSGTGLIWNA